MLLVRRRDYASPDQRVLWDLSTKVLEELTRRAKPMALPGPEVFAVLMIAIGRFAGRVGFRAFGLDSAWEHFRSNREFFALGFESERDHES